MATTNTPGLPQFAPNGGVVNPGVQQPQMGLEQLLAMFQPTVNTAFDAEGRKGRNISEAQTQATFPALLSLAAAGGSIFPQGFANLFQILQSQGASDPAGLNRELADIDRSAAQRQDQFQGQLARLGLSGSGLGQAVGSTIGDAGGQLRAARLAEEERLKQDRRRGDMGFLMDLLGLATQQGQARQQVAPSGPSDLMQGLTAAGQIAGSAASLFPCWVARSVYGTMDPRWLFARHYVLNIGPSWFRRLYMKYGERFARLVDRHPALKAAIRPLFDLFVRRAKEDLRHGR